ncbi:DUF6328 family protein [Isoptericola sp. NPDC019571]|uniref:DUF6328 family protein n=1 Tax=Isoptericola sp. NPDC019571 TaxID=3364008 RepID=UPI0037A99D42
MTDEPTGGVPDRSHGRQETPEQRSDRNWNELLQELRVMQTGVQILTGFLLILPFQSRFADLDDYQRTVYLTLVLVCVATTGLLVAPVALHRALFRKHLKRSVVTGGDLMARAGLVLLAIALAGTAELVFDVVLGRTAGIVVGAASAVVLLGLWAVVPAFVRHRRE